MRDIVTPRPASTLILVRDGRLGLEILLGEKNSKVNFAAGAFVFPGGALDTTDLRINFRLAGGLTDEKANQILGIDDGGLSYWIAAIRECFEEVGVLLAKPSEKLLFNQDEFAAFCSRKRDELTCGQISFQEFVQEGSLVLEVDQLHYFSRWVTHAGSPRRYDTRFFIAQMPQGQVAQHDGGELIDHRWLSPSKALDLSGEGKLNLMFPTRKTLEKLQEFSSAGEALDYARSARPIAPMDPRLTIGSDGKKLLVPGDYAYAEAGKLDPEQRGTVSREIKPGVAVQLDKRVIRLTAPNPSVMTGPGTNTYILGDAINGFLVVDPGPENQEHIDSIRGVTSDQVRWILCTHTHVDHSPGARLLSLYSGARVLGCMPNYMERQDQEFCPHEQPTDGQVLHFGDVTIDVIHTPGHASNHLCFLFAEAHMLFTGDHIMQGSTVVINPPDGNMSDYFSSLSKLYDYEFDWIAPGHGFLMDNPHEAIDRLLVHRRKREAKVINALSLIGQGTIDDLTIKAYDDVSPALHPLAKRSLLAHLIKLLQEQRVLQDGNLWINCPSAED